jgi:hypothetical protein
MMCLDNETWSLSRLSFNIRAIVKTSKNCFSHVSNDKLVDTYIKWNNNNHSCAIVNVDVSCLGSFIRSGFDGIIKNTFTHYFAGFSDLIQGPYDILLNELYVIYNGLLLAKNIFMDNIFMASCLLLRFFTLYLDIIFMLYWFKIYRSCSPSLMFLSIAHLERGINVSISSLNLELLKCRLLDYVSPPEDVHDLLKSDAMNFFFLCE